MTNQQSLRPGDLVVALQLSLTPDAPLAAVAADSYRSIGEVHNAVRRLRGARLVDPSTRRVEREPLLQFIRSGVPFSFPATVGSGTVGVATAVHVGPAGSAEPASAEFVWPRSSGQSRGQSLVPLHPRVSELAETNRDLRALLSLVDLVRVGGVRERAAAVAELERLMGGGVR